MSGDTTMLRHPTLEGMKYSRVLRLMRLSAVKGCLLGIGEKRSMRVHTTPAPYTSQECPECHQVARANRPSQAEFKCVECGFEGDADHVAARNINNRGMEPLRSALHVQDQYGRCSPKPVQRGVLKELLMAQNLNLGLKRAGGVTELLTPVTTKPGSAASP